MKTTLSPLKWKVPLNPKDELDWTFDLAGNLLETGETISSWTLTLSTASIAAGLLTGTGAYATALNGTVLKIWFSVDPAHQADADFDDDGVWLDMEIDITTNNSPPRLRSRTLLLRVARQ